jgi:hypothetical protein
MYSAACGVEAEPFCSLTVQVRDGSGRRLEAEVLLNAAAFEKSLSLLTWHQIIARH